MSVYERKVSVGLGTFFLAMVLCAVVMMVTGCGDGGGGEKESEAKTYEEAIAETHAITDDTSGCLPPAIKFRGKIYISRRDYQKELGEDVDCSELWDVGKVERSIENGTALSGKDEDYTANYADMVGETIYLRENGNLVIKNDIGASEYYIEGQDETYHDLYLSEKSDISCLVKTKTIKRKDDHFDYDIEYPYITPAQGEKNYDSVNKLIEDTVLEKTGYAEVERESDEEKQERKLYIKLDYKIRKLSHRILSVSFEGFYSEKNAIHPINLDFCFNYNLESDSEICLSNVVPDMVKMYKEMPDAINHQIWLDSKDKKQVIDLQDAWKEHGKEQMEALDHFYIEGDHVYFRVTVTAGAGFHYYVKVNRHDTSSNKYSQKEIIDGMNVVEKAVKSWGGCTLNELYYAGDDYSANYQDWAYRNKADDVIVFLSSFYVDIDGDKSGALNPDSEYPGYCFILVRKNGGNWKYVDGGY